MEAVWREFKRRTRSTGKTRFPFPGRALLAIKVPLPRWGSLDALYVLVTHYLSTVTRRKIFSVRELCAGTYHLPAAESVRFFRRTMKDRQKLSSRLSRSLIEVFQAGCQISFMEQMCKLTANCRIEILATFHSFYRFNHLPTFRVPCR